MCKRFFRKGNVTFVVKVFSNATLQKHMKECDSPLMFTEMNIKKLRYFEVSLCCGFYVIS